jgi:predicted Zn-dependent peptidase
MPLNAHESPAARRLPHAPTRPRRQVPLRRPPYQVGRSRLPNGLRLVTVETPHLHTAAISLYVRAGSRYETPRTNGLSHFVEHMLFRGSSQFPNSFALNLAIEEIGGTLYAETGRDYSLYQIPLQPAELPRGLAIMGDLFSTPSFRDIDLERQIIIEEILEDLDDDGRNVNLDDLARLAAWDGQPLGYTITGPLRNVRRFGVDDVRAHFAHFYGAANMVLCVAGPFRHARVEPLARAAFAAVGRGRATRPAAPRIPTHGPRFRVIHNESAQTQLQILFHALPESDPDYLPLRALSRVLDDGMSTRLHYQICDQKGLAYSVSGNLCSYHDSALVEIDAACAHAKLPDLVGEGLSILSQFRENLVSESELDKAKRRFRADLEACYDDLDSLCGWFGGTELYARPRSQEQRARELDRVRPEDIRRVARRVFRPERLCVVVVGALDRKVSRTVSSIVKTFQ